MMENSGWVMPSDTTSLQIKKFRPPNFSQRFFARNFPTPLSSPPSVIMTWWVFLYICTLIYNVVESGLSVDLPGDQCDTGSGSFVERLHWRKHGRFFDDGFDFHFSKARSQSLKVCFSEVMTSSDSCSLNTIMYNWKDKENEDPCGQLTWLSQQLQLAQKNSER